MRNEQPRLQVGMDNGPTRMCAQMGQALVGAVKLVWEFDGSEAGLR